MLPCIDCIAFARCYSRTQNPLELYRIVMDCSLIRNYLKVDNATPTWFSIQSNKQNEYVDKVEKFTKLFKIPNRCIKSMPE